MKRLFNFLGKAAEVAGNATTQMNLPKNLGGSKNIRIEQIPATTEEFIQLRNNMATTPEGGAAVFIIAAIKYTENPDTGRHWVIIATDKNWLSPSNSEKAYKGFDLGNSANFLLKQIDDKKYIPYSYLTGTSVANGYEPGNAPYQIAVERSADGGDGMVKVYIHSTGVDATRPITLKKNEAGMWKGFEYSSIFTGIQPPIMKSKGEADGDF